jgi:Na+/melibiose symporter-like transporter
MTLWAVLCVVLFVITFVTTRERVQPVVATKSTPRQDFADLSRNAPWIALFVYTLFNFAMLTYRGGAHYNFYHHFADKTAMFDFIQRLGLTTPDPAPQGGLLEWLGYIGHGTRETLPGNVADVFNSIINMAGFATTIVVIMLSAGLSKRFGKKAVIMAGFGLSALNAFAYFFLTPINTTGMFALHVIGSVVYAPTIAVAWAIYADAADYSELQTGRRFTGVVFAGIGFGLKLGLALGSAVFLWAMAGIWNYDTSAPSAANAIVGYHVSSSIGVALFFLGGLVSIAMCGLDKQTTLNMAAELAQRRQRAGVAFNQTAP